MSKIPESIRISVVIIAKNEAYNLQRLLPSVSWADEILVADTGSNDATAESAEKLGARVIELSWEGFGKTKQKAVNAAKYDWILSIDADEEVSAALQNKLLDMRADLNENNAYKLKRISWYLGKKIMHCGWQYDMPLRFFNRRTASFNNKVVHEGVKTKMPVSIIKEPIYHYTYPLLSDHLEKINLYTSLNVEQKFLKGRRYTVSGAIMQGMWKFLTMYVFKMGYLDGLAGFLLCYNSAYGQYLKYLKLWEHRRNDLTH